MGRTVAIGIQSFEEIIEVLKDILEAVLGIHIGDKDLYDAVERHKAKNRILRGGW